MNTQALKRSLRTVLAAGGIAVCASACTTTGPQPEAVKYPSLSPPVDAGTREARFEPAPSLTNLPLACRTAELSPANALDDDCNGQIDDGVAEANAASAPAATDDDVLVLALSYPQPAALQVGLRAADNSLLDLTDPECAETSSFCTRQIGARGLTRGDSMLVVTNTQDAGSATPSLVVSVQSHGKVTTYVAPVAQGSGEQVLGKLFLP